MAEFIPQNDSSVESDYYTCYESAESESSSDEEYDPKKLKFEIVMEDTRKRLEPMIDNVPWYIRDDYDILEDYEENPFKGYPRVSFLPMQIAVDKLFDIKEDRKLDKKRREVYGQFQKLWYDPHSMHDIYVKGGFPIPKTPLEIEQDKYFYNQFIKYFKTHRERHNLVQAYEFYKKKLKEDPNYFDHYEKFRWRAFTLRPPGKDEDFTSFRYSGRVGHEVKDLYEKYNVKPWEAERFLRKLMNDRSAPLYDQELARHVVKNITQARYYRTVMPEKRRGEKLEAINDVKKEFYHRATPHDWEMIRKIRARNNR